MIKIALFRPIDWIDKTICFFSRGNYSHVAFLLEDGSVIEAKPFKGVRKIPNLFFERSPKQIIELYTAHLTDEEELIIKNFLHKQIGKSYDYMSVLGFIINKSEKGRKKTKRWLCSELVFCAFKKVNIKLLERIDQWAVTPVLVSYSNKLKLNSIKNL
jgi:uncharacterized protein YycO